MLKKAFKPLILLGFFYLAVFQTIGVVFELYSSIWWFDIFMHVYGGFLVAGSGYALFRWENPLNKQQELSLLIAVLNIGILWEVFERFWDLAEFSWTGFRMSGTFGDTLTDIVMDIVGGLLFLLVLRWFNNSKKRRQGGC